MAGQTQPAPSFSPYRKWGIGLNVVLVVLVVLAVVVMVNYLSQDYFLRYHLSERTRNPLSPLTVRLLQSVTNHVKVTVYYDKDNALYGMITDLLKEYKLVNSRLSIQVVDYKRDPAMAQQLQAKYPVLASPTATNVIIFDCEGRSLPMPGEALAQVSIEPTGDKEVPYRRKLVAFAGEQAFTAMLLNVTSPKTNTAYFLEGYGQHPIDSKAAEEDTGGYLSFASLLRQNNVQAKTLSLLGTNAIPSDCNLFVVAGPRTKISDIELDKIDHYLSEGGRLLALFNFVSTNVETGLEKILAKWGVAVSTNVVSDPDHCPSRSGESDELIVSAFIRHPLVSPLIGYGVDVIMPRMVSELKPRLQTADAPLVKELMFSGERSFINGDTTPCSHLPLAVAVEKGAIKGVATERGTTRIVVLGDSFCLANHFIDSDSWKNHDFAGYLLNWLLDRPQLLEGLGAHGVKEYRLAMTKAQLQNAEWVLMAGMPGAALVVGWLVWLRRRR